MNGPGLVAPYAGQNQGQQIAVPAKLFYKYVWEEGAWVMKAYQEIFPEVQSDQFPPPIAPVFVPPPLEKTEIWGAMQTWPL